MVGDEAFSFSLCTPKDEDSRLYWPRIGAAACVFMTESVAVVAMEDEHQGEICRSAVYEDPSQLLPRP
jgi:hypothetical protein